MSGLRIIGGLVRGRNLKSPKGMSTRPTSDRVREALFNILSPRVSGSYFLDLFSGTGAVAIEALSRGAERAVMVEKDRGTAGIILSNLKLCNLTEKAEVLNLDTNRAISVLAARKVPFDLIFIDPPYKKNFEVPTMEQVQRFDLLVDNGILVVESDKNDLPPDDVGKLTAYRREKYGDTALTFYRYDS
ncbi:16S rRNA (guanine(966)-N(2))-methyltransferase RsmD [Desulforamulus ruminis]|uniref:16S rRNA (guanine(966)-N(2))-methyltransferase RsmD n=1 Tax=Desulforamulus ruminis TaxID=1564 RepID=UPI0009D9B1CF|nr:16S rRNA (guanine(966)-N(2))-methyltransferase RsmD [Desulforamulus ruminis]